MHRIWVVLMGAFVTLAALAPLGAEPVPLDFSRSQWIWVEGSGTVGETAGFRHTLQLDQVPVFGRLWVTADASYRLFVNGQKLGEGSGWTDPEQYDLAPVLKPGDNLLAIEVTGGQQPGLLVTGRFVDAEGRLLDLVSDESWRASAPAAQGWNLPEYSAERWPAATSRGLYGAAPWGRLTGLSSQEAQRAYDELSFTVPDETQEHPASRFAADYLQPANAARFTSYLTFDRASGRFVNDEGRSSRLFIRYRQAGGVTSPTQFDFAQYEADLDRLAGYGFDLALEGFSWADLLGADGRWRSLDTAPAGLPVRDYAYQALDYALDRAEAHGVQVLALLDLSAPLPEALVPAAHQEMVLIADSLWNGLLQGVAKVIGRYAGRAVVAGWVAGPDALPAFPRSDEPVVRQLWEAQLRQTYGSVGALRAAWPAAAAPTSFESAPLPATAEAPGAADLAALDGQWVAQRLASLAETIRTVDPHHLVLAATGEPSRPLALAGQSPFNGVLSGTVLAKNAPAAPTAPSYGETLAALRAHDHWSSSQVVGWLGDGGGGLAGAWAARALRQAWADEVGTGGAGMLTTVGYDALSGGAQPGAEQLAGLQTLADLVAASQSDYPRPHDGVLVLQPAGATPDTTSIAPVLAALGRAGLAPTVVPAEAMGTGGAGEALDLEAYRLVIVPSLPARGAAALSERLQSWLSAAAGRWLVLGWPADRPVGADPAAGLTGGLAPDAPLSGEGLALTLEGPLAGTPVNRPVDWPMAATLNGWTLPGDGTVQVVGRVGEVPVIALRPVGDSHLLVAGFALNLQGTANDDAVGSVLNAILRATGVRGERQTAPNVAAYRGTTTALVRETDGTTAEVAWRGRADTPPRVWGPATTRYAADGTVEVGAPIAPYQVRVLNRVGELDGLGAEQTAVVRASGAPAGQAPVVSGTGPEGLAVRLAGDPSTRWPILPAAGGTGPVEGLPPGPVVAVAAGSAADPEAFMVVGDYYQSQGDFGRASDEFSRLAELYPGIAVATTAQARRQVLLAESGAVVIANYARQPIQVRYYGPSTTDVTVPAGQSRTLILYAGDYREQLHPSGTEWTPKSLDNATSFTIAKGEGVLREWGVAAPSGVLDRRLNVRARLSDTEKQTILNQAKAELPAPAAAAGQAGGEAEGEQSNLTGPELPMVVEATTRELQQEKIPPELMVRNRSKQTIELTVVRFSVGVRPQTDVYILKPRGRLRIEMKDSGTYQMEGVVQSNNQGLQFGQFSPDTRIETTIEIRELTARELQRQAAAKTRSHTSSSR